MQALLCAWTMVKLLNPSVTMWQLRWSGLLVLLKFCLNLDFKSHLVDGTTFSLGIHGLRIKDLLSCKSLVQAS